MRRHWIWVAAIGLTFAFATDAPAQAPPPAQGSVYHVQTSGKSRRSYLRSLWPSTRRAARGHRAHWVSGRHRSHYAALVGDPGSGLGFYPLPTQYRIGAWRYRQRHQRPPWDNPVLFAIMADAVRYDYAWVPANQGYRYGVFDPVEGVGTPFFGGYYGSAGDDEERPFPFGRPYP
jgi:hypothetical protein